MWVMANLQALLSTQATILQYSRAGSIKFISMRYEPLRTTTLKQNNIFTRRATLVALLTTSQPFALSSRLQERLPLLDSHPCGRPQTIPTTLLPECAFVSCVHDDASFLAEGHTCGLSTSLSSSSVSSTPIVRHQLSIQGEHLFYPHKLTKAELCCFCITLIMEESDPDRVCRLLWKLYSETPGSLKTPSHAMVFPTIEILREYIGLANLTVAPHLLNVISAPAPPSLEFLKTLPTNDTDRWGVYLFVLEKEGELPMIYVGSGTDSRASVSGRLSGYELSYKQPRYFRQMLEQGYKVTYQGLLCWGDMPAIEFAPRLRLLFRGLEGLFTFSLWAMYSVVFADFGMSHGCPWSITKMNWRGLCGHTPLLESVPDLNLTEQQLLDLHAHKQAQRIAYRELPSTKANVLAQRQLPHVKEMTNAADARSKAKILADKKYHCSDCNYTTHKNCLLVIHLESQPHIAAVNERLQAAGADEDDLLPTDAAPGELKKHRLTNTKANKAKRLAEQRYFCSDCNYNAHEGVALEIHFESQTHIETVNEKLLAAGADDDELLPTNAPLSERAKSIKANRKARQARVRANKTYYCVPCDQSFNSITALKTHDKTPKHSLGVERAAKVVKDGNPADSAPR